MLCSNLAQMKIVVVRWSSMWVYRNVIVADSDRRQSGGLPAPHEGRQVEQGGFNRYLYESGLFGQPLDHQAVIL